MIAAATITIAFSHRLFLDHPRATPAPLTISDGLGSPFPGSIFKILFLFYSSFLSIRNSFR